jgi:hypothetical protein
MRYLEIASGIRTIVNMEEQEIIDGAKNGIITGFNSCDERKKEIIRKMIEKNILTLHKLNGKKVIAVNSVNDIWRDR